MKKHLLIVISLIACAITCMAETVVLHSGKRISGQILVQTEEVVIIRNAEGARFQFPMSEVETIEKEKADSITTAPDDPSAPQPAVSSTSKKAALSLELAAGVLYENKGRVGAYEAIDLIIGSRQIGGRQLTLGGAVGYMGTQVQQTRQHFLPLCVALRVPLRDGKHQPLIGANIGYGIALSKSYIGGLHAGADIGYRYYPSGNFAILVAMNVRFQQSVIPVTDAIENNLYTNRAGRNLVAAGLKLGLLF